MKFLSAEIKNKDIMRLKKRLIKHNNELLTFEGARNLSIVFSIYETGKRNGIKPLKIFKILLKKDFINLSFIRAP